MSIKKITIDTIAQFIYILKNHYKSHYKWGTPGYHPPSPNEKALPDWLYRKK